VLPNFATTPRYHRAATERRSDGSYMTSEEMTMEILERTGVACLAGSHFGFAPELLRARMAYVDFDGAAAMEAAASVPAEVLGSDPEGEAFVRQYAPRVADGLDSLCGFLKTDD